MNRFLPARNVGYLNLAFLAVNILRFCFCQTLRSAFSSVILKIWAISTVVAHFLHTEGVTGSNPVSPIRVSAILQESYYSKTTHRGLKVIFLPCFQS